MRAERAVEPTRSQNITVSCRRSAALGAGFTGGGGAAIGVRSVTADSVAPQPPQNLAVGGLSFPQAAQGTGNAAPHSRQNWFPAGTSARQFEQVTFAGPTCCGCWAYLCDTSQTALGFERQCSHPGSQQQIASQRVLPFNTTTVEYGHPKIHRLSALGTSRKCRPLRLTAADNLEADIVRALRRSTGF
jgi:hypothetical protein